MNRRGVGVEGAIGPAAVADLAALAESQGYTSFWFNILGAASDPIETMREALAHTSRIEIGVGLFPLDAYPAATIAPQLRAAGASNRRAIIGIATGQIRKGVVRVTQDALATLREALPDARLATGGYGPMVLDLGGRAADVVLANWMTPARLDWFIAHVCAGAEAAGRTPPPIYLYHRAATGADAIARLRGELAQYRNYPVHEKHQAEMGSPEWIGVAASDRAAIGPQLAPYAAKCEIVFKPLPHDPQDLNEWRSLLQFFAPDQ